MIRFEHTEVVGWEHAIRGMRNPMNSWERSDSEVSVCECEQWPHDIKKSFVCLGPNDHDLMMRLANGGPVHAKYRRMITVYVDVTAPLYWWKEFDTYKIGTVANSCSTMHKIAAKEFTLEDFSCEHLTSRAKDILLKDLIDELNHYRNLYLNGGDDYWADSDDEDYEPKDKRIWWQMIQLLPSSYNQKRTVMLNYEVLTNIYKWRKDHRLDEWREFCKWIEGLPYSEIVTGINPIEVKKDHTYDIPDRPMKDEFYYLCDRKACEFCSPECYHTGDLAHAINFTHEPTEEERRDRFTLIKLDPVNLVNEYFERMEYVK